MYSTYNFTSKYILNRFFYSFIRTYKYFQRIYLSKILALMWNSSIRVEIKSATTTTRCFTAVLEFRCKITSAYAMAMYNSTRASFHNSVSHIKESVRKFQFNTKCIGFGPTDLRMKFVLREEKNRTYLNFAWVFLFNTSYV